MKLETIISIRICMLTTLLQYWYVTDECESLKVKINNKNKSYTI